MAALLLLNLDQSLPDADPRTNASSLAGVLRFIDTNDDYTLDPMNRVCGDIAKRFFLHEGKINELVGLLNGQPTLTTFDNTPYVLTNGTHPFSNKVSGITPTLAAHLATKGYIDGLIGTTNGVVQALSATVLSLQETVPSVCRSTYTEFVWSGGTPQVFDLIVTPSVVNLEKIIAITIMEKLDVAQPTLSDPNPAAVWVYRQLIHGTCGDGMRVDDTWMVDNSTVRVLLPSRSEYSPDYPSDSGYSAVANPRQRFLSAVVTESVS